MKCDYDQLQLDNNSDYWREDDRPPEQEHPPMPFELARFLARARLQEQLKKACPGFTRKED